MLIYIKSIEMMCAVVVCLCVLIILISLLFYPFKIIIYKITLSRFNKKYGPNDTIRYIAGAEPELKTPLFIILIRFILYKKTITIPITFLIALLGFMFIYISYFGNATIGSFFERNSFEAKYIVYLNENPKSSVFYYLNADITVKNYIKEEVIYLNKVYWPNGGYITFPSGENGQNQIIKMNKMNVCQDINGKTYLIELTNRKRNGIRHLR